MKSKFELQKEKNMRKFEIALKEKKVDEALIDFLKKFNEKKFYYTTSSCAGRIILLRDLGNKKDSKFIIKWHRKVSADEVYENIKKAVEISDKGIIMFKQEPLILHTIAYDIERAKKILDIALKNGLKHSGLLQWSNERYIVEINGNERMSVLVANKKILVDKNYIEAIVEIANKNFEKNANKRDKFLNEILMID